MSIGRKVVGWPQGRKVASARERLVIKKDDRSICTRDG